MVEGILRLRPPLYVKGDGGILGMQCYVLSEISYWTRLPSTY